MRSGFGSLHNEQSVLADGGADGTPAPILSECEQACKFGSVAHCVIFGGPTPTSGLNAGGDDHHDKAF